MEKVESLVDRAKHLVLHDAPNPRSFTVDKFHPTVEKHIQQIYNSVEAYAPNTKYFLNEIQRDAPVAVSEETAEDADADVLASVDAFRAYMKDANSSAMGPEQALDLSAPLSDYFISSSHNTYLTGNQLYSDAAASAYTSVSEGPRGMIVLAYGLDVCCDLSVFNLETYEWLNRCSSAGAGASKLMFGMESWTPQAQATAKQAATAVIQRQKMAKVLQAS
jgi:hypothetical protein